MEGIHPAELSTIIEIRRSPSCLVRFPVRGSTDWKREEQKGTAGRIFELAKGRTRGCGRTGGRLQDRNPFSRNERAGADARAIRNDVWSKHDGENYAVEMTDAFLFLLFFLFLFSARREFCIPLLLLPNRTRYFFELWSSCGGFSIISTLALFRFSSFSFYILATHASEHVISRA